MAGVQINTNRAFNKIFDGVISKGKDNYVKLDDQGKLKIGYSTLAGKLKFLKLSDKPAQDQSGKIVGYGDRSMAARRTAEAIASAAVGCALEEIGKRFRQTLGEDAGHNGANMQEAMTDFNKRVHNEIVNHLLGGKADKTGLQRITVKNLRDAVDIANRRADETIAAATQRFAPKTANHATPSPTETKPLAGNASAVRQPVEQEQAKPPSQAPTRVMTPADERPKAAGGPVSTPVTSHQGRAQNNGAAQVDVQKTGEFAKKFADVVARNFSRDLETAFLKNHSSIKYADSQKLAGLKKDFEENIERKMRDFLCRSPRSNNGSLIELDRQAVHRLAKDELASWLSKYENM